MKNAAIIFLTIVVFAGFSLKARAADEPAERDPNRVPAMLGVNASDETRNLLVDDDGKLQVDTVTTVSTVSSVVDVQDGHIQIWDGATSTDVLDGGTNDALYTALTDGTDMALIDGSGRLTVTGAFSFLSTPTVYIEDNGGSITVDATDLDIRDLTSASDTVSIEGGNITDVSIDDGGNDISIDDGGNTITVDGTVTATATDLDIRDLTYASDTVSIEGGNSSDVAVTLDSEQVTLARFSTPPEFDNDEIGATSASGTDLDPSAESYKILVVNNGSNDVFCKFGTTPADNDGIPVKADGGSWTVENVSYTDFECYNPSGSANYVHVVHWR